MNLTRLKLSTIFGYWHSSWELFIEISHIPYQDILVGRFRLKASILTGLSFFPMICLANWAF